MDKSLPDQKIILHIDFDSFFASVEQQYNFSLRGKPIGVLAANSRSCIIASSREAKRLGIKTGARSFEAKQICPSIALVPADFIKYFEISKKFLNICKDYSPFVELFSIDEVFMDITKTVHLFDGTHRIISKIKSRIKQEIGEYITASIGISHNKLLAKMASSINKPDGVYKITQNNLDEVFRDAKLTDVCGVGERIKIRLNKLGIYNLLQLRSVPYYSLVSEFGNVEAEFLKNVSFGHDESSVIPYTTYQQVKSVGRSYCLPKNEYNKRVVLQNIYELCEEVSIKLRKLNKRGRTVGISLRGNVDFNYRKTFKDYFDTGKEIYHNLYSHLYSHLSSGNTDYIRQISVWVANLEDNQNLQLSLFDSSGKKERLIKTVDLINERFGDHTIRNGFLLYADKLTTVPNGYLADRYERLKLAHDSDVIG